MAAIDDDVRRLSEQLARLRYASELTSDEFQKLIRSTSRTATGAQKVGEMYERTIESIRYAHRDQMTTNQKLRQDFENMRAAVRASTQSESEKARKITEIDTLAAEIRNQALGEAFGTTIKTLKDFSLSVTNTLLKNMQSGASGIQMAGSLMSSTFDLVSTGGSQVGQSLQKLGSALMLSRHPVTMAFGALVTGAGFFANKVAEATKKIAEIALPILQAEVEKSNTVFLSMSQSGALFARGIDDMRNTAHAANLTLTQLGSVVRAKTVELSGLGLSITGAVKLLGNVLKSGGPALQKDLYKLGFGFEEQAGLVADVMENMRQAGTARLVPEEVARNVKEYAENSRVLSSLTGEDIKKRREEARTAAAQLAFQQKLAGMDETVRQNIVTSMEAMNQQQIKNFMESMVFGQVINREGAILEAMLPAYRESTRASVEAANNQTLTMERQTEINSRFGKQITKGLLEQGGTIGVAGMAGVGGIVGNLNNLMGQMVQFFKRFTPEGLAEAREAARGQLTAQGLTDTLATVQLKGQELAVTFERQINPLLGSYSRVLEFLMDQTKDLADFIENRLASFLSPDDKVGQSTVSLRTAEQIRNERGIQGINEAIQRQRQQKIVQEQLMLDNSRSISNFETQLLDPKLSDQTRSEIEAAKSRVIENNKSIKERIENFDRSIENLEKQKIPAAGASPGKPADRVSSLNPAALIGTDTATATNTTTPPAALALGLTPGSEAQKNFVQAMALAFSQSLGSKFDDLIEGQSQGNQIAGDMSRVVRNLG